jgi:hypothetical protein
MHHVCDGWTHAVTDSRQRPEAWYCAQHSSNVTCDGWSPHAKDAGQRPGAVLSTAAT